jgi:hypothetical protein
MSHRATSRKAPEKRLPALTSAKAVPSAQPSTSRRVRFKNVHKTFMHRIEHGMVTWGEPADLKAILKMHYIYKMQEQVPSISSVFTEGGPRSLRRQAPARKPSRSKQTSSAAAVTPCEVFNAVKGCHLGAFQHGLKHCCVQCNYAIGSVKCDTLQLSGQYSSTTESERRALCKLFLHVISSFTTSTANTPTFK